MGRRRDRITPGHRGYGIARHAGAGARRIRRSSGGPGVFLGLPGQPGRGDGAGRGPGSRRRTQPAQWKPVQGNQPQWKPAQGSQTEAKQAGNWPGAVKVVAEWFPESERALAAGLFNSGSAVGAILAPPIVAYLILRTGWQSAFAFVGLAGLVWLAFWFTMYDTPKAPAGAPAETVIPVRELLRTRFVWAFTFSKIFMDPVWYFYIFWFPEYLKHARGFDLAKIGIYGWIPFMVAGFACSSL